MVQRFENKGSRGFSLVETLAVVAILVILLSLSAVAAAYYRDYLKITELDNAARDIYMAAENRAVLLGGSGQLEKALTGGGAQTLAEGGEQQASVYVAKDTAASLGLLTGGAIDPALLNGQFYIVYDTASGAVTDVFYTEGPDIQDIHYALSIAGNRDKRMRPDSGPMLGYYGGEQEARTPYTPLPAPEVLVEVENGDLLKVHVTFRSLLGSDQKSNPYQYGEILHGTNAGGLAGELSGKSGTTAISKSLAASLISGTIAGGLVGNAQHTVNVDTSYADCYLKGETYAAGLIGKCKDGGTSKGSALTNVYAAGFIDCADMGFGSKAAGLFNVSGTVSGANVYTAVSYLTPPVLRSNSKRLR